MAAENLSVTSSLHHPTCRSGITARHLTNGMVYLRHPRFSSQIINITQWRFLTMCDGRSVEELKELAPGHLGFEVTVEQVRSTIEYLADLGLLEATKSNSDYRRVVDASALVARLAPLVRVLISSWFA